jgi:acyl-CoA thioester hydrolase
MVFEDFKFCYRFRVRWSETDAQGVVFNARYLDYADLAITEYWRAVDFRALAGGMPMEFHVAQADVTFKAPIKPDELIAAWVRTERIGTSSMTAIIHITGAEADDDVRAIIREVMVHVDLAAHKPMAIPAFVRMAFEAFAHRETPLVCGELIAR